MTLTDGNEVASTYEEEPFEFSLGVGSMEPELEAVLLNLKAGDEHTVEMSGDEIYGPRQIESVEWIERDLFPKDMILCKDLIIGFITADDEEVAGLVVDVEPHRVEVDFNHPLSGRQFLFKTTIIEVLPATSS
jgi:FKBP-type peptidyl-prolyl cis-trans isomerase SlpA